MRYLIPIVLILSGCVAQHQKGGNARTEVPREIPAAKMEIKQPENPEGISEMTYEDFRVVLHPDGTVERTGTKTGTKIGGSQDFAKILKEYSKTEYFKGMVFGLAMFVGAWLAWRREWPLIAASLAAGAIASIFVAWWAGALALLISAGLYIGYRAASPVPHVG